MKRLLIILFLLSSVCAVAQTSQPRYELITVSGTDTYVATVAPTPVLVNGFSARFKFTNANSGASTFNLNSLGPVTLRKSDGTALSAGDIPAGSVWMLIYDGTASQWRLSGGSGGAALTDGNGTTANGTAVDLGGTQSGDVYINNAGHNFSIYPQTSGGDIGIGGDPYDSDGGIANSVSIVGSTAAGLGGGGNSATVNSSGFSINTLQGSGTRLIKTDNAGLVTGSTTGTGVITALGVNVGSAGSVVVNGGALGTPSSGTGTNLTGIPESGVTNLVSDLALKAPLASPAFTGPKISDVLIINPTGNSYATDLSNTETGPAIYINRNISGGSTNEHGIIDRTLFANTTYAYNSFDVQARLASGSYDHLAGYQQRGELLSGASVSTYYSFNNAPTLASGTTATTMYGFYHNSALINVGATVTTHYALKVNTMKGATKWALYADTDNSFNGGQLLVGVGNTNDQNYQLSINNSSGPPTFGMYLSAARKALFAIASASNVGTPGSVTGDLVIRAVNQSILFSADEGTTTHAKITTNGIAASRLYAGGVTITPTALLHLAAGTATASTAPIKLTSGTMLTTPEAGVIETTGIEPLYSTSTTTASRGYISVNRITSTATGLTLDANHDTLILTATGQTATLPTAVGRLGRVYTIKLTASGTGTVATTSSQTIDGSTTYSLSAQYKYVSVQSDNANWHIIANN